MIPLNSNRFSEGNVGHMIRKTLSRIFVFLGIFCLLSAAYLFWERTNPYRLSFASYVETPGAKPQETIYPVRIRIPGVSVDVPVQPATITDGKWPASSTGVSHLSTSPIPGEQGNSILYGHNWSNLFGSLKNVHNGDTIDITLSNGEIRRFSVEMTDTVAPEQTHILSASDDIRLTLYTCTGFLDMKRFVVTAIPL